VLSYSLWESRVDAEEANRASAAWVQQNLSRVLVSVERYIGEVAFSHPHIPVHTPSD
jgi:hypothetical protein